jgi:hypothetical protein
LPLPPSVDVTAVVVLLHVPAVAPVTMTLNEQLVFAASEPPLNEIVPGDVVESEPPHVDVAPLVTTVRPAGSVSLKPMPESELERFGFVIVNVKVEVLPVKIAAGEYDLEICGGAITVSDAVA